MTPAPVLVEVERSGMVESTHRGSIAIYDDAGALVGGLGDPHQVIYPRSCAKPLQAVGMLHAGVPLDGELLALASASHSGEEFHRRAVREILARAGLDETALQCPEDLPYVEKSRIEYLGAGGEPDRVVMNCSGKHAAMLLTSVVNGWPTETYLEPDHPLQQHLRATVGELVHAPPEPASTDGCGAPLWAVPLSGLARAVAELPASGEGARVMAAISTHPEFSGGPGRDVTDLINGVPGLMAKDGAEAVQVMAITLNGTTYGLAMKVDDGAQRARSVVAAGALAALGVGADVVVKHLEWPVMGGGRPVGSVRPSAGFREWFERDRM
jgi:L-asparaginase II